MHDEMGERDGNDVGATPAGYTFNPKRRGNRCKILQYHRNRGRIGEVSKTNLNWAIPAWGNEVTILHGIVAKRWVAPIVGPR